MATILVVENNDEVPKYYEIFAHGQNEFESGVPICLLKGQRLIVTIEAQNQAATPAIPLAWQERNA